MIIHFSLLFFLFSWPFFRFVFHNDYPLVTPEVLLFIALFIVLALVFSRKIQSRFFLPAAYALAFFWLLTTGPEMIKPVGLFVRGAVCFVLFFFFVGLKQRLPMVIFLFIVGVLIGDLLTAFPNSYPQAIPASQASRQGGHVLYLILDEHIGVDGLPPEVPETPAMKVGLMNFFQEQKFRLYPKAFSPYFYSDDSIANILNGTELSVRDAYFAGRAGDERSLEQNALFDFFRNQGYAVNVYQANYINYCAEKAPFQKCTTYNKNSIKALEGATLTRLEKARVIGSQYLATNWIFREMEKRMRDRNFVKMRTGPLQTIPDLIKTLSGDVAEAPGKTLFFAHLMMPHFPYVYDEACRVRPVKEWENRNEWNGPHRQNTRAAYARKYGKYFLQMKCLYQELDGLFAGFKELGIYDDMTIILHGDHGSRINLDHDPYADYALQISARDMITSHSALFAIKHADQQAGETSTVMAPLTQILWHELEKENTPVSPEDPHVWLRQKGGKKELVKMAMPPF